MTLVVASVVRNILSCVAVLGEGSVLAMNAVLVMCPRKSVMPNFAAFLATGREHVNGKSMHPRGVNGCRAGGMQLVLLCRVTPLLVLCRRGLQPIYEPRL